MALIKVLVAHGHTLLCDALSIGLARCPEIQIVHGCAGSGPDVVEAVAELRPDVAVVDYLLEDMDGPTAVAAIRDRAPDTKVLLMSGTGSSLQARRALSSGAVGLLSNNVTVADVDDAIHRVHGGEVLDSQAEMEAVGGRRLGLPLKGELDALTPRELEILSLMSEGHPVEKIANRLGIKLPTLRRHVHNILYKAGVHSAMEAIVLGRLHGIIR